MKRLFTMIILAFVLVGFSVITSEAKTIKIRTAKLTVEDNRDYFIQNPSYVESADATNCTWTAVVQLPIGKRITKLKYYRKGHNGSSTTVGLFRAKFGDYELVANLTNNDNSNTVIDVETTDITTPMVKSGYTYFIKVTSGNWNSRIYGVKITHQD